MTGVRVVAVLVGVAATLAGCGASPASTPHDAARPTTSATRAAGRLHPDLGPFAGYMWTGDVDSAHADWTVPRLLPGSASGEAATWIGAEAPGPRRGAPFVQIGVNEGDTGGGNEPFYYAFYSTTTLHFHPVRLFGVSPGDQVSATLRRRGARWQIAFVDGTVGRERQLSVAEGAGRRFNEAQYTQEDVTDARTRRPFPYPGLSPVRFTGVAANGVAPPPTQLTSSWLTEADGYLAPAPLHGGAFALVHARLTAAGFWYLRAIATQDGATATATAQLLRWAEGEPAPRARVAARRYANVLRATVEMLDDQHWPLDGRRDVSALRTDDHALIALLSRLQRVTLVGRTAWAVRFDRLATMVGAAGRAARRALRLPSPIVPVAAG